MEMSYYSEAIVPYDKGHLWQSHFHRKVLDDDGFAALICLEHPSVITLGKNSSESNIVVDRGALRERYIELRRTERGGEVTMHMPGQLVVYPIFNLTKLGLSPRSYVCKLEEVVIRTLAKMGIPSTRQESYPGIWVEDKKICALGIRIKNRVCYHGLALNICNDLKLFDNIVPCGIQDKSITSIAQELGKQINRTEVEAQLIESFAEVFEVTLLKKNIDDEISVIDYT